ncbi:TIGR03118 family protein [Nocardia mangyaensis]|uniref:TIGR03118 family protein n=1 Tax=Nocardia mangyaensis TaxID=2213200 RepID=UPI000AB94443|nr:TIGR03118 family protein [Nocardia mangyaensis]
MNGQVRGARAVRSGLVRGAVLAAALLVATACSSTGQAAVEVSALDGNRYSRTDLVAAKDSYRAQLTIPELVDAWGLADRPKGAGGHFWVGAGGSAFQFLGDAHSSSDTKLKKLTQDDLKAVTVPGAGTADPKSGTTTGVVYNPAPIGSDLFVVRDQWVQLDGIPIPLTGSARHILATDSGKLSAWTEQAPDGAVIRRDGTANLMFDGSAQDMAFFGLALSPAGDKLLVADFGADPQIRTFDKSWQPVATTGFANPFATGEVIDPATPEKGKKAEPGDPAPYNVTTLGSRVFVSYAVTTPDDKDPETFEKAEIASLSAEADKSADGKPDRGKIAEFDAAGKLVRIIDDGGRLNAPWGVAIAPSNFGALSGKLLVANSGGLGRVLAYDDTTGTFVDYLRDNEAEPIEIAGLTALLFGNGDTLGDANALYFTAGPAGGKDGLFGSLRVQ